MGVARLTPNAIREVTKAETPPVLWFAAGSATGNAKTDHDKTEGFLRADLVHPQKSSSFWKPNLCQGYVPFLIEKSSEDRMSFDYGRKRKVLIKPRPVLYMYLCLYSLSKPIFKYAITSSIRPLALATFMKSPDFPVIHLNWPP